MHVHVHVYVQVYYRSVLLAQFAVVPSYVV